MNRILSIFSIVEILCAIKIVVFPALVERKFSKIVRSVLVSTAETESSKIRIGAFFIKALAMEIRCF